MHQAAQVHTERDALAVDLNLQLEQGRAALCSSERARAQEVEELRARLASLGDQHAKLLEKYQSAELLLTNVQARNDELTALQEQLALRYQEKLESEQLEREKLASELAGLRAGPQGYGHSSGSVAFGCTSNAGRSRRGARLDRRPPRRAGFTRGFRVIRLSASHDGRRDEVRCRPRRSGGQAFGKCVARKLRCSRSTGTCIAIGRTKPMFGGLNFPMSHNVAKKGSTSD